MVRDDEAYGAAGLLLATSDTFRHGLQRAFAYQRLWGDGERFALREEPAGLVVTFRHPGASALASAVLAECALVEVMQSARTLMCAEVAPLYVAFAHEALGPADALVRYFGVLPVFGQPENAIVLARALVDAPLSFRRELVQRVFERQCRHVLDRLPVGVAIGRRVRRVVGEALESVPAISKVAARLQMSVRTLQRKLDAEGTSFHQLVDDIRRSRASELAGSGSSLKEVAMHLGYSDPSGFLRARRRWGRSRTID